MGIWNGQTFAALVVIVGKPVLLAIQEAAIGTHCLGCYSESRGSVAQPANSEVRETAMPYPNELVVALEAALQAAHVILQHYRSFEAIADAPANITTQADRDSQETILQLLAQHFPDDALCAEESTPTLAQARHSGDRIWVVDPIDGTRGFAQKNGEFSVMIGLVEKGQSVLGVVLEPASWRWTYAVRGEGCWMINGETGTPQPCRVTATPKLAICSLTQSRSKPGVVSRQVTALQPATVLETHSAGIKLARVARGEADLYVNHYPNFHDWDICAGQVLVEEAGGRVTGLHGEAIHYGSSGASQRSGLLASNGILHDAALAKLQGVF
jgi:3'(2'), 5'-bisphosphate nucleotidase